MVPFQATTPGAETRRGQFRQRELTYSEAGAMPLRSSAGRWRCCCSRRRGRRPRRRSPSSPAWSSTRRTSFRPATEAALTANCRRCKRTPSTAVVATIPDLQGYPLEDYGYRLGRNWGVGPARHQQRDHPVHRAQRTGWSSRPPDRGRIRPGTGRHRRAGLK